MSIREDFPLSSFFPCSSDESGPVTAEGGNQSPGLVCVVECEASLNVIRDYLDSKVPGQMGPCTVIYSNKRATHNTVAVMSRDLYEVLEKEASHDGLITKITPYMVSSNNSPRVQEGQNENIFLRFKARNTMPTAEDLKSELIEVLQRLVDFGVIDRGPSTESWTLDVPLAERNSSKMPMEYAFVKFRRGINIEQPVYIRAILNGCWLEKSEVEVRAFWSDRGQGKPRGNLAPRVESIRSRSSRPELLGKGRDRCDSISRPPRNGVGSIVPTSTTSRDCDFR